MVNLSDFAIRPVFAMKNGAILQTGKRRYRFIQTPHLILKVHRTSLRMYQAGPLMDYSPYNGKTGQMLYGLAALEPNTLAAMHGSSFLGNCKQVLQHLDEVMKEVPGGTSVVHADWQLAG